MDNDPKNKLLKLFKFSQDKLLATFEEIVDTANNVRSLFKKSEDDKQEILSGFLNIEKITQEESCKIIPKFDETNSKIDLLSEELKKKLDEELLYEVDEDKIVFSVLSQIPPAENGKDYILTQSDKEEIASAIKVPIVEKIIERTETIIKQPIVTNEITNEIKEVAVTDEPVLIAEKLNTLIKKVDWKVLKNIPYDVANRSGNKGIHRGGMDKFSSLLDVSIVLPVNGQVPKYNSTTGKWENGNDTGSTSFLNLTDTPSTYVGQAGKYPVVNVTEDGLDFGNIDLSAYATTSYVNTGLDTKQATLVSTTNIKTINGASVLGAGDLVVGAVGANPSASLGLTAVNGSATTFLRSDGSPALSQAIAPTWTARHTYQPTSNGIAWQINTAAGVSRVGYDTNLSQMYIGDTGANGTYGLVNIVDVTHSFKDVITINKFTWGSGMSINLSTPSPIIKATGGSTFVSYTSNDTGTYFSNASNNGGTLSMRVDNDNYWTAGLYIKGFNDNSAPSSGRARSYGLYAQAQGHASGNGGATFFGEIQAPNIDGIRIQVAGSQTAPILRAYTGAWSDSSATINTNTFFQIDSLGAIKPASLADASASNDRIYYSTTASRLVYKDSAGVVNNLY